ncbi:MAG: isoquinoline 1-oxidoreductase [Alteromonadaceae bacterium]|mgnify:FL=1|uniref:xanthine dehydrogenase family protein molybdopterin-binding subunit n=1 Tax=Paraglaciecola chathamensis TaxID=368405 RepID=UPI000C4AFFCF|nr:molybdopterin cofactor-binding domain-containing protein [Paraglaciecola agarilytica]MBN23664.1 isoquinoline 1-oxidoreductase [Alteromonadaceae bacterium]|tara:strand:+ start:18272 stop:20521 length:2250 start_codon:yes stop_codon:yes gene_type:complete
MSILGKITRRTFVIGSAAITSGVLFGVYKYKQPYPNPLEKNLAQGETALTPYVLINANGVTIIAPRAEMGQGVKTTLAALVAEELDIDVQNVRIEHGVPSNAYYNAAVLEEGVPFPPQDTSSTAQMARDFMHVPAKFFGVQVTGGSSSTVDAFEKMRMAGATAREALLLAASAKLNVAKNTLSTDNGEVISKDGQRIAYTELASLAASVELPDDVKLKPKSEWKQLGRPIPRVDMVEKCTGTATFGIDVLQKDMLYATIKVNPHLGAKCHAFDANNAANMKGVKAILPLADVGAAVVATNTWYAFKAAEKIDFDWARTEYAQSTDELFESAIAAFNEEQQDSQNRDDGDVDAVIGAAGDATIHREYRAPLLAHATMEPMNATAIMKDGQLDVWVGTQMPTYALSEAARVSGIEAQNIRIHTTYLGGGFGRRLEMDFIVYAVMVAKQLEGTPVKVTWSREEDMTHDSYRPFAVARFKGVTQGKNISALDVKVSSPSVMESQMGRLGVSLPGPDSTIVQALWDQAYTIENYRVTGYRVPMGIPVSSWRSVGASQNGFFNESMIDELAIEASADPIEMRLGLITHQPTRNVLEAVANMANWGRDVAENHGLGVALVTSFGVPVAEIVEVVNTPRGIKILNVYVAADLGIAIDSRNIDAQLISAVNFGLAGAMMGEITLLDGKVQQTNFHNYDAIRMHQAPVIHTKILENGERIRGIGEPGTPPAAPALANAIFAATGLRMREMPFNKHIQFV